MCCVLASFTLLNPNSHFYYINFIWCFSFLFLSKRFLSPFEEEKHYGIGILKMEINLFLVIFPFWHSENIKGNEEDVWDKKVLPIREILCIFEKQIDCNAFFEKQCNLRWME